MNITKDFEYTRIVRANVENSAWLESFLIQSNYCENTKRLAWLRLMGLIETWDMTC